MELGLPLVFILELFQLLEATLRSLPCGPCQRPSLTYSLSAQFLLSANLTRSGPSRYFSFDELNPLTTHWRSNIPLFTGSTHSVVKDLEVWHAAVCVCVCTKSLQSCQTLCDSVACSLPGSSVQRILQTRTREWVAVPSSRGSSRLRDWTCESCLLHRQVVITSATWSLGSQRVKHDWETEQQNLPKGEYPTTCVHKRQKSWGFLENSAHHGDMPRRVYGAL